MSKIKKGLETPTFHCLISGHDGEVEGKDFEQTQHISPLAKDQHFVSTHYYERIGWRAVCVKGRDGKEGCGCQWNFR